jgi:CubicO group peptidase (beta-lactamase class C family)
MSIEILGTCDRRFVDVRDAFAKSFNVQPAGGSSVAVMVDGALVVDLWAGPSDAEGGRAWSADTIVRVHSTTKGLSATCAHILVDRGFIDLDAPVAKYWPDFAQAGKAGIPVRWLLSHRAGLPGLRQPLTNDDRLNWEAVTAGLAAETPWWEPGTRFGYHGLSFNYLVGELVRRVSGRSAAQFFREEVAEPLGLDACLNCATDPEYCYGHGEAASRLAATHPAPPRPDSIMEEGRGGAYAERKGLYREHLTSSGGHANARALARLYSALGNGSLDGVSLLRRPETMEAMRTADNDGVESSVDYVAGWMKRYALGYTVPSPFRPFSPNPRAFGHSGSGGSIGFADPEAGLGFGFAPGGHSWNTPVGDLRWPLLVTAVYDALGSRARPRPDPAADRRRGAASRAYA